MTHNLARVAAAIVMGGLLLVARDLQWPCGINPKWDGDRRSNDGHDDGPRTPSNDPNPASPPVATGASGSVTVLVVDFELCTAPPTRGVPACPPAPVAGAIVTMRDATGAEAARATTDASGTARFGLGAGRYKVEALPHPGTTYPPVPQIVDVLRWCDGFDHPLVRLGRTVARRGRRHGVTTAPFQWLTCPCRYRPSP